jgi:hypothetical protein
MLSTACAGSSPGAKPSAKVSPDLVALHESYREARRTGAGYRPDNPLASSELSSELSWATRSEAVMSN